MNRKVLTLTWLLVATIEGTLMAQFENKNFSFQVMAGHNDWSAKSFAWVDGVVFIHPPSGEDLTFVYGLGVSWHPNQKLSISLNYEGTNMFQTYVVYDEEGDTFLGEPLIKVIGYNNQPRFFGLSLSYEILRLQEFRLSVIVGADRLSSKLDHSLNFNFNDATQKLSDAVNATEGTFKNKQFNLSYGARLSYKRYFLRVVFKEDFNRSITDVVHFEGNTYQFLNNWKIAFIQFGATVFRF